MRMHLSIISGMSAFKYSELAKASFSTTLQIAMINFMKKILLEIFSMLCDQKIPAPLRPPCRSEN